MTTTEFEQEVFRLQNKLYRFAYSLLKDETEAQDTVQEVVLKLWKKRRKLEPQIDTLSMTMIHNHCIDIIRKRKHQLTWQNSSDAFSNYNYSNFEQTDFLNHVKNYINTLPLLQQQAVYLKDIEELEYTEISKILNQPINSIRANVARARKKILHHFKQEYYEKAK